MIPVYTPEVWERCAYEAYWIEWCEARTRLYTAFGNALQILGPILAEKQDKDLLKIIKAQTV